MIEIIAHRGYSAERPENTIASFDLAVNSGFPLIELDTHLTLDKIPVVMHDSDVDRTTNGTGPINSLTLEEIKKLDALAIVEFILFEDLAYKKINLADAITRFDQSIVKLTNPHQICLKQIYS